MAYNAYARDALDTCDSPAAFVALVAVLHRGSRGLTRVPWQ